MDLEYREMYSIYTGPPSHCNVSADTVLPQSVLKDHDVTAVASSPDDRNSCASAVGHYGITAVMSTACILWLAITK